MTEEDTRISEDAEEEEEDGLGIQIGMENGDVLIIFSQKIATLGLPSKAARKMARALYDWADKCDEVKKAPDSLTQ